MEQNINLALEGDIAEHTIIIDKDPFKPKRSNISGALTAPLYFLSNTTMCIDLDRSYIEVQTGILPAIFLHIDNGTAEAFSVVGEAVIHQAFEPILKLIQTPLNEGARLDPRELAEQLKWWPNYVADHAAVVRDLKNLKIKVQNERKRHEDDRGNKGAFDETSVIESNLPSQIVFNNVPLFKSTEYRVDFVAHTRYHADTKLVTLFSIDLLDKVEKSALDAAKTVIKEIKELDLSHHTYNGEAFGPMEAARKANIPVIWK